MQQRRILTAFAVTVVLVSACGGGGTPAPSAPGASQPGTSQPPAASAPPPSAPAPSMAGSVGNGEGALTVLAWPGYAENGSTDPTVNWVKPFEDATGCKTTVQVFGTSDEAFSLFTTNPDKFDVISASGDASLRLVRAGFVQAVNTDLVPNYADIFPALKDKPYNTVNGVHYGIPHGRGSNLLMWRTDKVTPAPTSWAEMFDPTKPWAGKVSVYNAPIYIADAAVVLMKTKPELNIKNPYALDATQLAAAKDLLVQQKALVGKYWGTAQEEIDGFTNGDMSIGSAWQYQANVINASGTKTVQFTKPKEGATGWSDTWMISSKAKHPNCMYLWMNYIISPKANADVTVYFGEAPVSPQACEEAEKQQANFCTDFHAADETYFKDVWYWNTPTTTCLDGRTDVQCTDFDAWTQVWTEVTGS
jgi:putative spermidine/putrescine transport system substrate-binding protein